MTDDDKVKAVVDVLEGRLRSHVDSDDWGKLYVNSAIYREARYCNKVIVGYPVANSAIWNKAREMGLEFRSVAVHPDGTVVATLA